MNTKIRSVTHDIPLHQSEEAVSYMHSLSRLFAFTLEVCILSVLALVAFIPRLLLAMKLDVVTDEVVYILASKKDVALLTSLQFGAKQWNYNYEHPPLVKFFIGFSLNLNTAFGTPLAALLAARLPNILMGTLLVIVVYWLGHAPFGRTTALTAALCLAVSPWLVYFSALAYLDMTMTALVTVACLLTWHAIYRPWLYVMIALLLGFGAASKYTAVLVIPGIVIFTAYYFLGIRPSIPLVQRPRIPWLWWLAAIALVPGAFLFADPAIWPQPIGLLVHSLRYEWEHSYNGHLAFLAGHYNLHAPHWATLYIIFAKVSVFVTLPAIFLVLYSFVQLIRFHQGHSSVERATTTSFLCIWLIATSGMFSLLNIVVGTHYELPIAIPVVLAGAAGLATLLRRQPGSLTVFFTMCVHRKRPISEPRQLRFYITGASVNYKGTRTLLRSCLGVINEAPTFPRYLVNAPITIIRIMLLALALIGPHLVGLMTIYAAEGYTSEFFPGENTVLQVAYPGYREAVQWIAVHTHGIEQVGLVALPGTLNSGRGLVSWYDYNKDLPASLILKEAHSGDAYDRYDYLVWPMHLVQRGFTLPPEWRDHVVHRIMGGSTIYCYILARS